MNFDEAALKSDTRNSSFDITKLKSQKSLKVTQLHFWKDHNSIERFFFSS